jgi:hypothetical protein
MVGLQACLTASPKDCKHPSLQASQHDGKPDGWAASKPARWQVVQ